MNIFEKMQNRIGHTNEQLVKNVYYILIKIILEGLKYDGKIVLPDFGEFSVMVWKERDVKINGVSHIPAIKVVKFKACNKLKKYVRDLE